MGLHLKSVIVVHSVFHFLVGEFTVFEINNIACPFFIDADLHLRNEVGVYISPLLKWDSKMSRVR